MEVLPMVKEGISLIESEKEKVVGIYYASDLDYCMMKIYYSYIYPAHHDLVTHRRFAIGSALHSVVQRALDFYGRKHPEIKVFNEPTDVNRIYQIRDIEIHGRPDTILVSQDKMDIIEFKSIKNFAYLREAQDKHISQLNYYLHFYPLSEGHVIYVNKAENEDELKEFSGFKYDEGLFNIMVDRALTVHDFLIRNMEIEEKLKTITGEEADQLIKQLSLPAPEGYLRGGTTDWECKNCPVAKLCYQRIQEKIVGRKELRALTKKVLNEVE
jgi:hypothetical protein